MQYVTITKWTTPGLIETRVVFEFCWEKGKHKIWMD